MKSGAFHYFFGYNQYGAKSKLGQDPDRDPYADRTQWSGQHFEDGRRSVGWRRIVCWCSVGILPSFMRRSTKYPRECFILVLFRLVLLPHHLVRRIPSSRQWAEHNVEGRRAGFPIFSDLFCFRFAYIDWSITLPIVSAASRFIRRMT